MRNKIAIISFLILPALVFGQTSGKQNERIQKLTERDLILNEQIRQAELELQNLKERKPYSRFRSGQWNIIQTPNSKIYYGVKGAKVAEEIATRVEKDRKECLQDINCSIANWSVPVNIYIHDSAEQYARIIRQGPGSPGHSQVGVDRGQITSRRVDLRYDGPDAANAIWPHERVHVCIADRFNDKQLPRWADEGCAVLYEPIEKRDAHVRNLQGKQLFPLKTLMTMTDYPPGPQWPLFYGESVALSDFLIKKKDFNTLLSFIEEAQKSGYDAALKKYYNLTFSELEIQFKKWLQEELKK